MTLAEPIFWMLTGVFIHNLILVVMVVAIIAVRESGR